MAEANAIGNSEITAGTTLKVPDVGQHKNDATTFKPYNPAETIGNTSPTLPYIPAPEGPACWKMVVMMVVIVVVMYFTAGAAAGGVGLTGTTVTSAGVAGTATTASLGSAAMAGGTAVTAAGTTTLAATSGLAAATSVGFASAVAAGIGAVAGSIAGQLVGKALGIVDHFSLREAMGSGITAALTAGIGSLPFAKMGSLGRVIESSKYAKAAMQAVMTGFTSYIGNKIAGVPNTHFSWKSVAVNATTNFVSKHLLAESPSQAAANSGFFGTLGKEFGKAMVSRMVRSAAEVILTGKSVGDNDPGQILGDAFGNALGQAIVGTVEANKQLKSTKVSASQVDIGRHDTPAEALTRTEYPGVAFLNRQAAGDALVRASTTPGAQLIIDPETGNEQLLFEAINVTGGSEESESNPPAYSNYVFPMFGNYQAPRRHQMAPSAVRDPMPNNFTRSQLKLPSGTFTKLVCVTPQVGIRSATWSEAYSSAPENANGVNENGVDISTNRAFSDTNKKNQPIYRNPNANQPSQHSVPSPTSQGELSRTKQGKQILQPFELSLGSINGEFFKPIRFGESVVVAGNENGPNYLRVGYDGLILGDYSYDGKYTHGEGLESQGSVRLGAQVAWYDGKATGALGTIDAGLKSKALAQANGVARFKTENRKPDVDLSGSLEAIAAAIEGRAAYKTPAIDLVFVEAKYGTTLTGYAGAIGFKGEAGLMTVKGYGVKAYFGAGAAQLIGGAAKQEVEITIAPRVVDKLPSILQNKYLHWYEKYLEK